MYLSSWFRRAVAVFCVVLLIQPLEAVQKQEAPEAGPETFLTYAPFWKVDQGFSTKLVLRNRHKKEPALITPILYSADGRAISLSSVELPPNTATVLALEDAMLEKGEWANQGSVALEFEAPNAAMVTGYAMVTDEARSLFFNSMFRSGFAGGRSNTLHAAWWLEDEETSGNLVLFNSSAEPVTVQPSVALNLSVYSLGGIALAPGSRGQWTFAPCSGRTDWRLPQ